MVDNVKGPGVPAAGAAKIEDPAIAKIKELMGRKFLFAQPSRLAGVNVSLRAQAGVAIFGDGTMTMAATTMDRSTATPIMTFKERLK